MKANETFAEHIGLLRRSLRRALVRRLALETERPLNQLLALRSIAVGETCTQVELSARLVIDPPAASRLVTKLERDGLIRRRRGRDRREVALEVTPAARRELKSIRVGLRWLDDEMKRILGASAFRAMMQSMDRVRHGFDGR